MEKTMHTFNRALPNGNIRVSEIENCVTNSTDRPTLRALAKMFGCTEYATLHQQQIVEFLNSYVAKHFQEHSANDDSGVNLVKLTETYEIVLRQMHEQAIEDRNMTIANYKKFAALILLVNLGLAIIGTIQGATGQPTTGVTGFQVVANLVVLAWFLLQND